jgi:hypothetical protein
MTERAGEFIRNFWFPIAGLVALAVAWGASTAQIGSIAKGQDKIDAKIDQIAENLASTKTTAQIAIRDIDELRGRLNALETRRER